MSKQLRQLVIDHFLEVLKIPLASELTIKRKIACNPALVDQNVRIHSGHIHVSFAFFSNIYTMPTRAVWDLLPEPESEGNKSDGGGGGGGGVFKGDPGEPLNPKCPGPCGSFQLPF